MFKAETPLDAPVITRNKDGEVKLVCSNKNAFIYYTTDGKEPQPGIGTRYQSPVPADGDQIIKAVAVDGTKKSITLRVLLPVARLTGVPCLIKPVCLSLMKPAYNLGWKRPA